MSIKDCSDLATIVVMLLTIPISFYYIIKIVEQFKTNKKQTAELANKEQDDKLSYDTPCRVSSYKTGLIHFFAFFAASYIILSMIEIVTTMPQAGFGGPLPKWGGRLLFTPTSGFVVSWIFLSMFDTVYCLCPKDFKKPYTKARRLIIAIVYFIIGMSMPWLEGIISSFN